MAEFCNQEWIDASRKLLEQNPVIEAERFYQEAVVSSGLFEEAYELFPRYNSTQAADAADWMMQQLESFLFNPCRSDVEFGFDTFRDDVYEMIIAGLT